MATYRQMTAAEQAAEARQKAQAQADAAAATEAARDESEASRIHHAMQTEGLSASQAAARIRQAETEVEGTTRGREIRR